MNRYPIFVLIFWTLICAINVFVNKKTSVKIINVILFGLTLAATAIVYYGDK